MKKRVVLSLCLLIVLTTLKANGQHQVSRGKTNPYGGALLYTVPRLSVDMPLYSGQPSEVSSAYYWLDSCMREYDYARMEHFFGRLGNSDTSDLIANIIYRVTDDNPLSFFQWLWMSDPPQRYRCAPGAFLLNFESRLPQIYSDTLRTLMLIKSDIIAHVRVVDTMMKIDPFASIAKRMVRVICEIQDPIKGKYVPGCPIDGSRSIGENKSLPEVLVPVLVFADSAEQGACLEFEYSLDWGRSFGEGDVFIPDSLIDINGQAWIQRDSEYIVFLNLVGISSDNGSPCFSVQSLGPFGSCASMYPIRNGIVYDPNDDFGFGSASLTSPEWKSRLRARISSLTNPN